MKLGELPYHPRSRRGWLFFCPVLELLLVSWIVSVGISLLSFLNYNRLVHVLRASCKFSLPLFNPMFLNALPNEAGVIRLAAASCWVSLSSSLFSFFPLLLLHQILLVPPGARWLVVHGPTFFRSIYASNLD